MLELGIFHGHTTAVLAAIFKKVISIDINAEFLQVAAEYNKHHSNVVFLSVDSLSDAWGSFKNNPIDVIVIDGDHSYEAVHADTLNSLRHLQPLKYLVFDDFFHNWGVRRTIQEFRTAGGLSDCQAIGHGWDGSRWMYHDYIDGLYTNIFSELPEGFVCKRGELWNPDKMSIQEFLTGRYLVYALPIAFPVPSGLWQFLADGSISVTSLGKGTWKIEDKTQLLQLVVQLPGGLSRKVRFNSDRTAFVMAEAGETRWYLVGDLEHFLIFQEILGMSSSQVTI